MSACFIVNPAAGHGRGRARWEPARALAAALWPDHEVCVTEGPGHGRHLARLALEGGAEVVLAVGGDGTLGEVVDGFLAAPAAARERAAVATFPVGSGCDFARHAGLPRGPEAWAAALSSRRVRRLDAALATFLDAEGKKRARHFLNVVSLGLAGDVAIGVERRGKLLGGTLTYLVEALIAVANARPRRVSLVVDGVEEPPADYHMISVANTSTTGGGMRIAPGADAEDGLLDLLTVGPLTRGRLLTLLPRVYAGGHIGADGVVLRRARRVEIKSEELMVLNIDGDLDGATPAVFEVLPRAVPFLL